MAPDMTISEMLERLGADRGVLDPRGHRPLRSALSSSVAARDGPVAGLAAAPLVSYRSSGCKHSGQRVSQETQPDQL
jgi:hypothetical protein